MNRYQLIFVYFLSSTINTIYSEDPLALHLSPYIRKGQLLEARNLSQVDPKLFLDIKSYSGYMTVAEDLDSHLFFWYFPNNERPDVLTPWIIWLQGGPGGSSLTGLFNEMGPFEYVNSTLKLREWSWCKKYSMLFLDNPVGAGYSYTWDGRGYSNDTASYTKHFYTVLQQFLTLFPENRAAPLYIAGESYAGHYIPAFAKRIQETARGNESVNLQGLIMGNPTIEREAISNYSAIYYNWGLIDLDGLAAAKPYQDAYSLALKKENNDAAYKLRDILLDVLEDNLAKITQSYNVLKNTIPFQAYLSFLNNTNIRNALHVGARPFSFTSAEAREHLKGEFLLDLKPVVEKTLERYRVLIYCGQLDVLSACVPSAEARRSWKWSGSEQFLAAPRFPWTINGTTAGYYKTGGNLTEVLVRGAGHLVPLDKPAESYHLITSFIEDTLKCPNCTPPEKLLPNLADDLKKWNLDPSEINKKESELASSTTSSWTVFSSVLNIVLLSGIGVAAYLIWRKKRRNDMLYLNATDAFEEAQSHSVLSLS